MRIMPDSMRAVRYHELGSEEVLKNETTQVPEPNADEVLIRVKAAGVNPIDCKVRDSANTGLGQNVRDANDDASFPITPGWDVSGVVEGLGEDVSSWKMGQEVYGMLRFPTLAGTYAEYVAAPADDVAQKPSSLSHSEAAAVPMVTLTAWQALFNAADISSDDRVLIHAAAGGVGHMAVQLAKEHDAHVIGTASGSNEEFLLDLGVDKFVNYRKEGFEKTVDAVDVVIDPVGGETLNKSFNILNNDGVLVSLLREPNQNKADQYNVDGELVFVEPNSGYLNQIRDLIDENGVDPHIRSTFSLIEAVESHRLVQKGHGRGKTVLNVD